jgi:hypothetical protein
VGQSVGMAIVWGLGGLLVALGAVLVAVSVLRRGGPAESQRLGVVAGLVMTALGVVAISAAALAGGDDDGDDAATTGTRTTESPSTSSDDGASDDDDGGGGRSTSSSVPDGDIPLPDCVEQHLAAEPVVADEDHYRLDEGVSRQVIVVMHAADAIALNLVDDGELLGVMRIGDQTLPVDDILHVYDVVDPSCQAVPFTPQDTADEAAQTHRTVVPLELAGQRYEVTFFQDGIEPELDVVLRRVA